MQPKELPPDVIAALVTLIEYAKNVIRESVEKRHVEESGSAYYDAKSAPMGPTSFLRLAREGIFPACKVGRKVLARRVDVDGWIKARAAEPRESRTRAEALPDEDAPFDPIAFHQTIMAFAAKSAGTPVRGKVRSRGRSRS